MAKLLTYEQKDTWMDRLCGVTKLIYFLAWSITSMLTYDTRVLAVMLVFSLILFKISKTEWKQVGSIFKFIMFFLVINVLAIFIFAPDQGTKIYGTKHVLWQLSAHYPITAEQLFYELNIILKYFTIIPAVHFCRDHQSVGVCSIVKSYWNQLQHRLCGGNCTALYSGCAG